MRYMTKEVLGLTMFLVALFLIVSHSTGFARSIGAIATGYTRTVKVLQGR
jgi:hydrogenase-4 membrane subunit HyfE